MCEFSPYVLSLLMETQDIRRKASIIPFPDMLFFCLQNVLFHSRMQHSTCSRKWYNPQKAGLDSADCIHQPSDWSDSSTQNITRNQIINDQQLKGIRILVFSRPKLSKQREGEGESLPPFSLDALLKSKHMHTNVLRTLWNQEGETNLDC